MQLARHRRKIRTALPQAQNGPEPENTDDSRTYAVDRVESGSRTVTTAAHRKLRTVRFPQKTSRSRLTPEEEETPPRPFRRNPASAPARSPSIPSKSGKQIRTAEQTESAAARTAQFGKEAAHRAAVQTSRAAAAAKAALPVLGKAGKYAGYAAAGAAQQVVSAVYNLYQALLLTITSAGTLLILVVVLGGALLIFGNHTAGGGTLEISPQVRAYEPVLTQYAEQYGVGSYVPLLEAIMMQESGGEGGDPMQATECGYNTRFPDGITDPEYSIAVGVHEFADCIAAAGVTDPLDPERIPLALQGYNYGPGYISWALRRDGGYTSENALQFSQLMCSRYGYPIYGDPEYVSHVLRYYPYSRVLTGGLSLLANVALTQVGNIGGEPYWSWYGFESHVEWCACFVSWCAEQCGYLDGETLPRFSLCTDGVTWFLERERWMPAGTIPQPGNLIFFDWNGDGQANHVGIVESTDGETVYTIEGNSGDRVRQRHYPIDSSRILGYGVFTG